MKSPIIDTRLSRILAILLWSAIITSAVFSTSCVKQKTHSLRPQAISLYGESRKLIETYIDSMSAAKDSAGIEEMEKRFEDKLAKLNFEYPANTDFELSEDENDTIIRLTEKYIGIRDSLLYRLAHPLALVRDSLASDSAIKNNGGIPPLLEKPKK